ncbi:MAG TPA: VOC family protein, partial [Vicinamibacteria bacterium]|nr:VOC family protein [Vicinamibacteria bacterium]
GWTVGERTVDAVGPYSVARIGERSVAGLMSIREEWGPVAPRWQPYFSVQDCARAAQQAAALKGQVIAGPTDVPDVGRFAILADPSRAAFAVYEAPPRP